jgi:hypothetical protein
MPPPEWVDDPTIKDDEWLWRRIHPTAVTGDQDTGQRVPQSGAFRDTRGELSVFLASETTLPVVLRGHQNFGVAEFQASAARSADCIIVRDPLPDNPAHALVCGKRASREISIREAKMIKKRSRWVVLPASP